jgi:hypothetical protein
MGLVAIDPSPSFIELVQHFPAEKLGFGIADHLIVCTNLASFSYTYHEDSNRSRINNIMVRLPFHIATF